MLMVSVNKKRKSGFKLSKEAKKHGEEIKKKLEEEMPVIKATGGEKVSRLKNWWRRLLS